jgi:hypothetical protein
MPCNRRATARSKPRSRKRRHRCVSRLIRPSIGPASRSQLRDVATRKNNVEEASASGFVQKMSARAGEMVLSAASIKRLVSAAQPLIKSLDDDQKRRAMTMARAMGLGGLADRFE